MNRRYFSDWASRINHHQPILAYIHDGGCQLHLLCFVSSAGQAYHLHSSPPATTTFHHLDGLINQPLYILHRSILYVGRFHTIYAMSRWVDFAFTASPDHPPARAYKISLFYGICSKSSSIMSFCIVTYQWRASRYIFLS